MKKIKPYNEKRHRGKRRELLSFRSDIGLNISDPVAAPPYSFIRTLITIVSALSSVFMIEGFLSSEFTVTATLQIFICIVLTSLSVLMISSETLFLKITGSVYLILNTVFLITQMKSAVSGMIYTVYSYAKKARLSIPLLSSYITENAAEDVNTCFITLAFLSALTISLACIYKTNFPLLFICTFPVFELGAFWGWEPYTWTLGGMLSSWIVILSLNLINHTTKKKGSKNTFAIYAKKKAFYMTNEKIKSRFFSAGSFFALIVALCSFTVCMLFVSATDNYRPESFKQLRRDISNGFDEMTQKLSEGTSIIAPKFPGRGRMIGGINGGRLGHYDKISFSGITALRVTASEEFDAPMYLRGYAGEYYHDNSWDPIKLDEDVEDQLKEDGDGLSVLDLGYVVLENIYGKLNDRSVTIKVINASSDVMYAPYNTDYTKVEKLGSQKYDGIAKIKSKEYTLNYFYEDLPNWPEIEESLLGTKSRSYGNFSYNYEEQFYGLDMPEGLEKYGNSVYERAEYTQIPDDIYDTINAIGYGIGLSHTKSAEYNAELIKDYFDSEGFYYTTEPGVTPADEDFIQYFLTKQKKGYCTYFASAGTMLMRYAGYPARYVEGYVIESDQYVSSDRSMRVSDRSAHAWCEVYLDGIGWYPIEFTPGYDYDNPNLTDEERNIGKTPEDSGKDSTSSKNNNNSGNDNRSAAQTNDRSQADRNESRSNLSSERTGSSSAANDSAADNSSDPESAAAGLFGTGSGGNGTSLITITPQMIYTAAALIFVILFAAAAAVRRRSHLEKTREIISGDPSKAVIACYMGYQKYLNIAGITFSDNISDTEFSEKICKQLLKYGESKGEGTAKKFSRLSELAVTVYMGAAEADDDDAEFSRRALEDIKNMVYEKLGRLQRFTAKWIHNLY